MFRNRQIKTTKDGSKTIFLPEIKEHYHSIHGAIQESQHVFINQGLKQCKQPSVDILEIGFGTGLNALLTFFEAQASQQNIHYTAIEAYPLTPKEVNAMDYCSVIAYKQCLKIYRKLHLNNWETTYAVANHFILSKHQQLFQTIDYNQLFNLIYFDAFSARVQPELWTEDMFNRMFAALKPNGFLVTYSAKGSVRRAMLASGFKVEKLQGPPGKREMLKAIKV